MTAAEILAAVRSGATLEGSAGCRDWSYRLIPGGWVTRRSARAALMAGKNDPGIDVFLGWAGCVMRPGKSPRPSPP